MNDYEWAWASRTPLADKLRVPATGQVFDWKPITARFAQEPEEPQRVEDDTISKSEIKSVLKRLHSYYDGRARAALKLMRDSRDAQSASEHLASAVRWEAKCETVLKVAENFEIELENKEA